MIEIETRQLASIPILHTVPAGRRGCLLPYIIFYHGFTSSSLICSYSVVALAQAGFRAVMPDVPDHGAHFKSDAKMRMHRFWHILQQNMQEFTTLRAALVAESWLSDERFAVGGASMGGMTALDIMARHPEVKCVASLMGSGYFTRSAQTPFPPLLVQTSEQQTEFDAVIAPLVEWDVTHQLSRPADRLLLLWHGQDDDVVPAAETFRLQQALIQAGLGNSLTCLWEAGVRHHITPEASVVTVTFFRQHL